MIEESKANGYELGMQEDYFGDTEFMLYTYKVERCMISQPHAWKNCPFVHHQEPIKRRHPTQHMPHLCPLVKKGQTCPDDKCCWAHNAFELWLHPERYRTIMCRKGAACGRGICFFAHSETELRVPSKAKAVDLSANPAAAAAAVEAALKFKAVAQALPAAAISAAPVSGKRSPPVSLQVPSSQPSMSLGVPYGQSAMSLGVPEGPMTAVSMSLGVPEGLMQLSPLDIGMQGPTGLQDFGPFNARFSMEPAAYDAYNSSSMPMQLNWGGFSVSRPMDVSGSSSNSSSCTRLDAGDVLMSDLYTPTATDGSHNSLTAVNTTAVSAVAAAAPASTCYMQTPQFSVSPVGFAGFAAQQQQPLLLDLAQAAAAVRAELERGLANATSVCHEAALQAAADRVAALLFNGPYGGLCVGQTCRTQCRDEDYRKTRSLDLPAASVAAVTERLQQQTLQRADSV